MMLVPLGIGAYVVHTAKRMGGSWHKHRAYSENAD